MVESIVEINMRSQWWTLYFLTTTCAFLNVGVSSRTMRPLSETVLDFEPLRLHQLEETINDHSKSTLRVKFEAFDEKFDFTLVHSPVFSSESVLIDLSDKSQRKLHESMSYHSTNYEAALTLDHTRGGIIRGFIEHGNDIFYIRTVDEVNESMKLSDKAKEEILESRMNMVIFRDSDIIPDPENPQLCGVISMEFQGTQLEPTFPSALVQARRDISVSPPPPPCPEEPINLNMAFAADSSFLESLEKAGYTFESWLDTNINIISTLYLKSFHTSIKVTKVYKPTSENSPSWDQAGCRQSIEDKLDQFSKWRATDSEVKLQPEGLFHLMSGCYSSGAVGLAWLGVLCITGSSGWSGSYADTAVSSGGLDWKILAHEMGHQFGAPHNTEENPQGLMYPYVSEADVFTRSTQQKVCKHMAESTSCFDTPCNSNCPEDCGEYGCCGEDKCGNSCGTCEDNRKCESDYCVCLPNCDGRDCGEDGCGSQCGHCSDGKICNLFQCVDDMEPSNVYLDLHNEARSSYNLKHVSWSTKLASLALKFVEQCSNTPWIYPDIGYNFARVTWHNALINQKDSAAALIIRYWLSMEYNWNCITDECQPDGNCRMFTQMVHEKVTQIGCAYSYCSLKEQHFLTCYYDHYAKYVTSRPFDENHCKLGSSSLLIENAAQQSTLLASSGMVADSSFDSVPYVASKAKVPSLNNSTSSFPIITCAVIGSVVCIGAIVAGGIYVKKRAAKTPYSKKEPAYPNFVDVNVMNPDIQSKKETC